MLNNGFCNAVFFPAHLDLCCNKDFHVDFAGVNATALLFLLTFPVHFFFVKNSMQFFSNCIAIIFGKKTWVGYTAAQPSLPYLRKSVLAPNGKREHESTLSPDNLYSLNYWYARNYEPLQDVKTIFTHYKYLGS